MTDPFGCESARLREHREILAAQHQRRGPVAVDGEPPRCRGLVGVRRAYDAQARHCPQGCELLDGLVRRAVLAEADRVVGEEVHDMGLRERREADRRAGSSR